jgi:hypothetical protein
MNPNEELELLQLKEECQTMAKMLKKLQEQEINLKSQNKILAREAINLGYEDSFGDCGTNNPAGTAADNNATKTASTSSSSSGVKKIKRKRKKET